MKKILCLALVLTVWCVTNPVYAAKYEIRFGHDQTEQSPHHDAALFLKKLVEEGSNGEIEITVFPNQLLGTGSQMVEMVQAGAVDMIAVPTARIQAVAPAFQILDLPFLFPSKKDLYDVLYKDFGRRLFKPLETKNMTGLTYWGMGFKQFTSNFPIESPADFRGTKIRVMPSPVIREQFIALGASPVPIEFGELYGALQQKVVDGQENPLVGIWTMKLYEVQTHMTLSNHAFLAYGVVINKTFFDKLPSTYQKLFQDAAAQSAAYQLDLIEKRDQGYLETIENAGVIVTSLSAEQQSQFRQALTPVYDWYKTNVAEGAALLESLKK